MECKYRLINKRLHLQKELIDTLWNVNEEPEEPEEEQKPRINRYIMECKLFC